MRRLFQRFLFSETGAVTVDWVVLTAACIGLGFGVVTVIASSEENVANAVSTTIATITPDAGD